ncbi:MAG: SRPBCC domain-containing protein [Chloroflexota bacterium]
MATIERMITLNTDAQTAYDAISSPVGMTKWFCDEAQVTDDGFSVAWKMEQGSFGFAATITENEAGRVFAYRTIEDDATITRFEITPQDKGCEVQVTEGDFADTDAGKASMTEHENGWDFFLGRLQGLFV